MVLPIDQFPNRIDFFSNMNTGTLLARGHCCSVPPILELLPIMKYIYMVLCLGKILYSRFLIKVTVWAGFGQHFEV